MALLTQLTLLICWRSPHEITAQAPCVQAPTRLCRISWLNCIYILYMEAASTDEFPDDGVCTDLLAGNRKEIVQEL